MDVYLDNAATTQIDKMAMDSIIDTYNSNYGNPSSIHKMGYDSENILNKNIESIGKLINTKSKNIIITSGGTESNNTALWQISRMKNKNILTSGLEHPSVLKYCEFLKSKGISDYKYYSLDSLGRIDLKKLEKEINKNTGMITIPFVNSEVGIIQELDSLTDLIKSINDNILIHVDGVQAFGKLKIDINKLNIDFMSFSSHKIHGPKGIGGLYVKEPDKFIPMFYGGGQQRGLRSGTEDVPSIVSFAKTCEIAGEKMLDEFNRISKINKKYRELLKKEVEDIRFNGSKETTSPYILNFSIKDIKSEVLIHFLEMDGIFISSGSACSSNRMDISSTYKELKLDEKYVEGTVRISFGRFSKIDDVEFVVEKISKYTKDIRKMVRS